MRTREYRLSDYQYGLSLAGQEAEGIAKKLKAKQRLFENQLSQISFSYMVMASIIFICSVYLEVVTSYEMYLDLASRNVTEPGWIKFVAIFLIIFCVSLAALAAHLMRLWLCKDLRKAEISIYLDNNYSNSEALIEVKQDARKGALLGIVMGGLILAGIYFVSMERVRLLSDINGELDISLISVWLPVIFVFFEIVFGTHILIAARLLFLKAQIRILTKRMTALGHKIHQLKMVIRSCTDLGDDITNDREIKPSSDSNNGHLDHDFGNLNSFA